MIFDEQNFASLLGTIDLTHSKIKQLSNYILEFVDNSNTTAKIIKHYFISTKSQENRLAIIYLIHEVFDQSTSQKNDILIVEFGDILYDLFGLICDSINDDLETINILIRIVCIWRDKLYFSYNFISQLMDKLKQKRNEIYENVPNIKFNENIMKETIKKINQTKETKELFELDTWEINIKRMNERIDTEKLDDLLNSNEIIPNSNAISSINDIENTILKLREIIIYDICKREKLIGELAENLNKEKEIFFKIEE
jgi:hypothetical protein